MTLHPGIDSFRQLLRSVCRDPAALCMQGEPGCLPRIVPGSPVAVSASEFLGRWSMELGHVPLYASVAEHCSPVYPFRSVRLSVHLFL